MPRNPRTITGRYVKVADELESVEYEDGVRCVVMPCCAFTMDACHTDGDDPNTYTCPQCGVKFNA